MATMQSRQFRYVRPYKLAAALLRPLVLAAMAVLALTIFVELLPPVFLRVPEAAWDSTAGLIMLVGLANGIQDYLRVYRRN